MFEVIQGEVLCGGLEIQIKRVQTTKHYWLKRSGSVEGNFLLYITTTWNVSQDPIEWMLHFLKICQFERRESKLSMLLKELLAQNSHPGKCFLVSSDKGQWVLAPFQVVQRLLKYCAVGGSVIEMKYTRLSVSFSLCFHKLTEANIVGWGWPLNETSWSCEDEVWVLTETTELWRTWYFETFSNISFRLIYGRAGNVTWWGTSCPFQKSLWVINNLILGIQRLFPQVLHCVIHAGYFSCRSSFSHLKPCFPCSSSPFEC